MTKWERAWVRCLDSAGARRYMSSAPIRSLRRQPVFRSADLLRRDLLSRRIAHSRRDRYAQVKTLCLTIGATKSGGSMIGSFVDAHPDACIADEFDVFRHLSAGFKRDQIFALLERGARREAIKGRVTARRLDAYSLAVPEQSQGRSVAPLVLGDTKAGITTRRLGADPALLDQLRTELGDTDLRLMQVVRNPFDPITAMILRGKRSHREAAARYFDNGDHLARLHDRLDGVPVQVVRYEHLIDDAVSMVREVCEFLSLPVLDHHLEACASVVDPHRRAERDLVEWSPAQIAEIEARCDEYEFLSGYRFTGVRS